MATGKKENIGTLVYRMIEEAVTGAGYDIWDVDYHKEGSEWDLEIIIENRDRSKPICLEDCEKVTHIVSPILDEKDPIPESYCLEVSSAGLERNLKTEAHFLFAVDKKVEVSLFTALDGKKKYCGVLKKYGDGEIELECEGTPVRISREKISKAVAIEEI